MARRFSPWVLTLAVAGAWLATGCGSRPTYPKSQLADSLHRLLAEDRLDTSVRVIDRTLAVQVTYPRALIQTGSQITIGPAFDEAARKVLTAVHRVLLSSDAEIAFYVLLLSDPGVPGAYLTIVRYMDDIRRANANVINTPEMLARTVLELNYVGSATTVTLEQYVPREIRLDEFLSWQLARRIQNALTEELQGGGLSKVGRCAGRFQDGEFAFTLDVSPAVERGTLDEATVHKIFHTSTNVIAKVLSSYRFESYRAVRLTHPLTGRHLVLPKTNLDVFR